MRAAVPAPTPVLLGYADRFSAQAGDTLRFMVSCEAPSFDARLVYARRAGDVAVYLLAADSLRPLLSLAGVALPAPT